MEGRGGRAITRQSTDAAKPPHVTQPPSRTPTPPHRLAARTPTWTEVVPRPLAASLLFLKLELSGRADGGFSAGRDTRTTSLLARLDGATEGSVGLAPRPLLPARGPFDAGAAVDAALRDAAAWAHGTPGGRDAVLEELLARMVTAPGCGRGGLLAPPKPTRPASPAAPIARALVARLPSAAVARVARRLDHALWPLLYEAHGRRASEANYGGDHSAAAAAIVVAEELEGEAAAARLAARVATAALGDNSLTPDEVARLVARLLEAGDRGRGEGAEEEEEPAEGTCGDQEPDPEPAAPPRSSDLGNSPGAAQPIARGSLFWWWWPRAEEAEVGVPPAAFVPAPPPPPPPPRPRPLNPPLSPARASGARGAVAAFMARGEDDARVEALRASLARYGFGIDGERINVELPTAFI